MEDRGPRDAGGTPSTKSDWLLPASLVLLSLVPVAAGIVRVAGLAAGGPGPPADARFFASPTPAVTHILSAALFCVLGAFQFAPGFRRRHRRWHRTAGRLLIPSGLIAAGAGLWMTKFYPNAVNGGDLLYSERLLFGAAMILSLAMATVAIRRREFARHGAWMIRAYAIGQGAGTQVLTGLPWIVLAGTPGVTANALLMGAGWLINIIVAEVVILRWLPQSQGGLAESASMVTP
jgi:uncharacterized membrane protein